MPFRETAPKLHTRRALIRSSALSAAAALAPIRALAWCAGDQATKQLPRVDVSPNRVVRTVVGLRPYREQGFRVERERLGDKVVIHNYGHGGCGLTMSWGTAKLAADLGLPGHRGSVAVIGSGAVGLATARLLQDQGFPVRLYTDALPPETTSNLAGGQWGPSSPFGESSKLTAAFKAQFLESCPRAYQRFQTMVGPRYGIRWVTNYIILSNALPPGIPSPNEGVPTIENPTAGMMPNFRVLSDKDNPFAVGHAIQFDFMLIEPPLYLQTLLSEFREAGGTVVVRKFNTPGDLHFLSESLIFNCTGLGARELFGDTNLQPLQGQVSTLLPQPEIDFATSYVDTYMFPRRDGILIGGTHELGNWS